MALYAVDDDDLIYAGQAEPGTIYWCLDCFAPVKRRNGRHGFPHFYHLRASPQCRLYSKTEDHLLAQIQLQKLFPEGVLQMESPFLKISRIADLCWEKEKIVFEIQCSPLAEAEAEARMRDYRGAGYEVVWLLDDRRYNKRMVHPVEDCLRKYSAYYLTIRRGMHSEYYDQFEVFAEGQRVKKGRRMPIDLKTMRRRPNQKFDAAFFPKQIIEMKSVQYFAGDRMDRALRSHHLSMQNWRALEIQFAKKTVKPGPLKRWLFRHMISPYLRWLKKNRD